MEVDDGGFTPALFVARNEHVWAAERRRQREAEERRQLRNLVGGVSIGVSVSTWSSRARVLVRRARSMFTRTDVRHLVHRFAAICRHARF